MSTRALVAILAGLITAPAALAEDTDAEMPGDGLDLYAVLDTFAESESIEDFENRLNDADAELVNLDLNGDDEVDYVTVVEEVDGTAHVIFLRVPLSEQDSQDVAHIAIDKVGEDVTAQVIGDETLYGPDYVVEPETTDTAGTTRPAPVQLASAEGSWHWAAGGTRLTSSTPYDLAAVIVVSSWRVVRVIYKPGYSPWRSPYRWHRYPAHYRARRPAARSHYRNRHAHHARKGYRRTTVRRSNRASNVHKANRVSSPNVRATPSSRPAAKTGGAAATGSNTKQKTSTQKQKGAQTPNRVSTQPNSSRNKQPGGSSQGNKRQPRGGGSPRRR
jgi:hypothetical protein